MSEFIDLQDPKHVDILLEVLHDGSEVKPLAYNVVINLLRFVPKASFYELINLKSSLDTDPQSWKLRALLWRSFLIYNGVLKLTPIKHVPPLTMFSYGPQIFPASLTSVAQLPDELQLVMEQLSNEAQVHTEEGPTWMFVEINLEFCVREPQTIKGCGGPELNMLEMMHFQHACAVGCARQLSEELDVSFVPKPLDSLLDKAFFRQKDIHDLIRTKVPKHDIDGIVEKLEAMAFQVYERKKTKIGSESVILHGICTSIWNYYGFIWVEIQEDLPLEDIKDINHIEYEINRSVRSFRYETLLEQQQEFQEVNVPEAGDKISDLFDSFDRFDEEENEQDEDVY